MKTCKANLNTVLLSLFELVVGILLLISPVSFTKGIVIAAGIMLMAVGLITLVRYFRAKAADAASGQLMFKALILLLLGLFCAVKSGWIIAVFPLLTMVYGVVILLTGLAKVQWTVDAIRMKKGRWWLFAIGAVVSILCAVVIFIDPFGSTAALWIFTGVSLILESAMDIVIMIVSSFARKEKNA